MTKNLKKQKEKLLKQATLTKSEIMSFKKLFNGLRFMPGRACYRNEPRTEEQQKAIDEVYEFLNALEYDGHTMYKITKEQTKQGIDYLKKFCFKVNGDLRKGVDIVFTSNEIDIIKNFSKFRFIGFYTIENQYHNYYSPVWRTYDKQGNYFDYICEHWCKPEVL